MGPLCIRLKKCRFEINGRRWEYVANLKAPDVLIQHTQMQIGERGAARTQRYEVEMDINSSQESFACSYVDRTAMGDKITKIPMHYGTKLLLD